MKKYLPLLGAGVLAVGIMLGGVFIGYQINKQPNSAAVGVATSTPAPEECTMAAVGSIAIPGYDTITLKAGQRIQNITLVNPPENNCFFVISILLPDGQALYKSGYIAPGSEIDSIKLPSAPAAGTYEKAILRYACWSADEDGTLKEVNGADTICTLEVEP